MSVPAAPTVYEVDELSELLSGEGVDTNEGEWYAIRTDPWPCPACGEVFDWVTACHHVVVTDNRDDLIDHAVYLPVAALDRITDRLLDLAHCIADAALQFVFVHRSDPY